MSKVSKVGIKNILVVMDTALSVGGDVATALEDGKLSLSESLGLAKHVPSVLSAIKAAPELPSELKDLDAEERQQIVETFAEKFELDNAEAEARVERLFHSVVVLAAELSAVASVAMEFRAAKK